MKTIKLDLYDFNELDADAKQKAIVENRDYNLIPQWWDFIYDDFITICAFLGIAVGKNSISFGGFYTQGNGSGFSSDVNIANLLNGMESQGWREYAPDVNFEFPAPGIDHRVMALIVSGDIQLEPKIIGGYRGNYVIADMGDYPSNGPRSHDFIYIEIDKLEKWLQVVANKLNELLYKALEKEYDSLTSDEAVAEALRANGLLFTADGRSASAIEKLIKKNNK